MQFFTPAVKFERKSISQTRVRCCVFVGRSMAHRYRRDQQRASPKRDSAAARLQSQAGFPYPSTISISGTETLSLRQPIRPISSTAYRHQQAARPPSDANRAHHEPAVRASWRASPSNVPREVSRAARLVWQSLFSATRFRPGLRRRRRHFARDRQGSASTSPPPSTFSASAQGLTRSSASDNSRQSSIPRSGSMPASSATPSHAMIASATLLAPLNFVWYFHRPIN